MSVNRPAITILTAVIIGHMAVFWGLSQLTPPVLSTAPQPVQVRFINISNPASKTADTQPVPRSNAYPQPKKIQPALQLKTTDKADVQPIAQHKQPPIHPPVQPRPVKKPPQAIIQSKTNSPPILSTRSSTHNSIQPDAQAIAHESEHYSDVVHRQDDEQKRINEQKSTEEQQRLAEQQIEQQRFEQQRLEQQRRAEQLKLAAQQKQQDEQQRNEEQRQKALAQPQKISAGDVSWARPPQYDAEMVAQYLTSQQGKKNITIQISVDAQGIISDAKLVKGSGIARLDDYVLRQTKKARSTPYRVNGVATAFTTNLQTTFETQDGDF